MCEFKPLVYAPTVVLIHSMMYVKTMSWSSQISWKSKSGWMRKAKGGESALISAVKSAGLDLSELSNQTWESGLVDGIKDTKLSSLILQQKSWSSVLLPLNCKWDNELATKLSNECNLVILFLEVRQTAWGFITFETGVKTNIFWRSSSFDNLTPSPANVDPNVIAKLLSVNPELISPYLKQLNGQDSITVKAFPEDKHRLDNHWVRVDFMNKLGVIYPDPSRPETRYVLIE